MKSTLLALALLMGSGQTGTLKIGDCTIVPEKGMACPPQPEPIDVPAVQETRLLHKKGDSCPTYGDLTGCVYTKDEYGPVTTCSDRSRILLTAEDNTHHCVKFK